MARAALRIEVAKKDQRELKTLLSGGVRQVRVVLRALALLLLGKGASAPRISAAVPLTPQAIRKVGHRYLEGGLERALYEKERPGAAALLEDSQRQPIIAMVCSDPPEGRARWTVRLVAEEAVKRRLVPRVGRETVRVLLLHHDLKPWREKMWWCAGMNRHGVEDARASRERKSDPLGPEFCAGHCEVLSEA
jgi:putative transposase